MRSAEIRRRFLDFFARHGHEIVPSSSLVPADDPTLLFTNAGMVQFKDIFLGREKATYPRAASVQRCVRAGGKHNDLENVGYTARHHTFFEMLGNFSFGDYFKRDAIRLAWDFLANELGLDTSRLWVTVNVDDDEAAEVWLKEIGIAPERFARISGEDNFWSMGETGPCGPCSEIFYDHGPQVPGAPPGSGDVAGDRYVEIWNLVFMQYNRDRSGRLEPLPRPSVDTGMGLERLAAVMQGVHSNYEIDLFRELIHAAAQALGVAVSDDKSLRVIADHIRSSAFLIADGVYPSNEGRGYVLRRIIRRAVRHGHRLGAARPFFHRLVAPLVVQMGDVYPEIARGKAQVERILRQEEERFGETLAQGLKLLDEAIADLQGQRLAGETVFKLYDTYGFPVDLTADIARERGLVLDMEGFEREMAAQRARARAASRFAAEAQAPVHVEGQTEFCGYTQLADEAKVTALFAEGAAAAALAAGQEGVVVLERTPFYAEGGGQVGDRGRLRCGDAVFEVADTHRLNDQVIGHFGRMRLGVLRRGERVRAEVDAEARRTTACNHSATHLLHAALKQVLGEHVQQKGSLVAPDRLRFDFSHPEPLTSRQITDLERLVNTQIRANHPVQTRVMGLEEAKAAGAAALFGEKYGARVRVVGMGEFSLELCGGTHVGRTGDIGLFKIVSETGIAAGVRRIEAVTADQAVIRVSQDAVRLERVAARLKSGPEELEAKIDQLLERMRALEKEVERLQARLAAAGTAELAARAREIGGVKVVAARLEGADSRALRSAVDALKVRLERAVIVLASVKEDRVQMVAGVTPQLTDRIHAGRLINEVAAQIGGRGGGRADMAQAGGGDLGGLDAALGAVYGYIGEIFAK